MSRLKAINDAVYVAEDKIVSCTKEDVQFLKDCLRQTALSRKRIRICAHKSTEDALHEMIMVFEKGSYIRPSKHIGKEESIHILEGTGNFVFFDEKGEITQVVPLGDATTGRQRYVRTPVETYHTLLITSEYLVVQETTQGPFSRDDTICAEWGPEDQDVAQVEDYMAQLADRVARFTKQKS